MADKGMGYYSGFKEGLDTLTENKAKAQETQYKRAQTEASEYKFQQEQMDVANQNRAKAILQNVINSSSFEEQGKTVQDVNSTIANTLTEAGKQILAVDPKTGLDLIKQGGDAAKTASLSKYHAAEAKKYQYGIANDLYAQNAPDGSDWADTQMRLSEVGVVVPPQFQTWGPETAAWVNRRAIQSEAAIKVLDAQQRVVANNIKQQQVTINQENAQTKQFAVKAKEAKSQASYKPLSGKPLETTLAELDTDDKFEGLDAGVKLRATQDYANQIQQNLSSGMPLEIARATARNNIVSRIKNNTFSSNEYNAPVPAGTAKPPAASGPKVGETVRGWTFLGGDPSNPSAWKK